MTRQELEKWHKKQGWGTGVSSDYFGITQQQFNNWLHGRKPIPAYVDKIIALEDKIALLNQQK